MALTPFVLASNYTALVVPAGVAVLWALMYRWTGAAWPRTELNWPIAMLLVWTTASLFFSRGEPLWAMPKIATLAWGVAWFFALVRWHRNGLAVQSLVWLHIAACLVLTLAGLVATNWLHKVWPLSLITAQLPQTSLGVGGLQPNAVAGTLLLLLPLCWLPLRRAWEPSLRWIGRGRMVAGAVLVMALLLLVLTQSRGGWLGAVAVVFVLASYRVRAIRIRPLVPLVLTFGLACGVVAFGAGLPGTWWVGGDLDSKLDFRIEMWRLAGLITRDFPWTGVGFNGFRNLAQVLYTPVYPTQGIALTHPHNMWLSAVVDSGLPGLAIYIALWGAAIRGQLRLAASGRGPHSVISCCLLAAWVGFWTFGIADAIPLGTKLGTAMWLSFALSQCLRERSAA